MLFLYIKLNKGGYMIKYLLRKKAKFIGQGFIHDGEIFFVEDLKNGYALYPKRFNKKWIAIYPKNLLKII